jgi:hypothetical protein
LSVYQRGRYIDGGDRHLVGQAVARSPVSTVGVSHAHRSLPQNAPVFGARGVLPTSWFPASSSLSLRSNVAPCGVSACGPVRMARQGRELTEAAAGDGAPGAAQLRRRRHPTCGSGRVVHAPTMAAARTPFRPPEPCPPSVPPRRELQRRRSRAVPLLEKRVRGGGTGSVRPLPPHCLG